MAPQPILISAGEASGDLYAARLAAALRQRADVQLFGMGGPRMREAGVELVADYAEVSVVGIVEIVRKLPALRRVFCRMREAAEQRKPRFAILTDFPGFHLRLSRVLKRRGVQNIFFVCPQFWAWRPWRANLVRRRFARGLCIFPFEEAWYRARGVNADFIGHPLVGQVAAKRTRAEFAAAHGLDASKLIVALLPGSRLGEIEQNLPPMLAATHLIAKGREAQFIVALAPGPESLGNAQRSRAPDGICWVRDETYDAVASADLAIVSSGTATVETALLGTPMIVVYRVNRLTAAIGRMLIRTPMFAMVNLIAGRKVVPELIQEDFTPERVAAEAARLLDDAQAREAMRTALAEVRERLGPPGAIDRAADLIVQMLKES